MARREIDMFQCPQVLVRMRRGDTDRKTARSKCMGRHELAKLRKLAARGVLTDALLPEDAVPIQSS